MRIRFVVAVGTLLATSAAFGQTTTRPAAPRADGAKPARVVKPDNEAARREADERQRRWDERMRRATKSMCDRC